LGSEPGNAYHLKVAALSKAAHDAAPLVETQESAQTKLAAIELELDRLVAEGWGVSEREFRQVRERSECWIESLLG
jgi:hypothetical protein